MRLVLILGIFLAVVSAEAVEAIYTGAFSDTTSSAAACDPVFVEKDYDAHYHVTGPTGRTAVIHFRSLKEKGFFHGLTLVGLLGPDGDVRVSKQFERDGVRYQVVAEGLVDPGFLWLTTSLDATSSGLGTLLCRARGEFTSF